MRNRRHAWPYKHRLKGGICDLISVAFPTFWMVLGGGTQGRKCAQDMLVVGIFAISMIVSQLNFVCLLSVAWNLSYAFAVCLHFFHQIFTFYGFVFSRVVKFGILPSLPNVIVHNPFHYFPPPSLFLEIEANEVKACSSHFASSFLFTSCCKVLSLFDSYVVCRF